MPAKAAAIAAAQEVPLSGSPQLPSDWTASPRISELYLRFRGGGLRALDFFVTRRSCKNTYHLASHPGGKGNAGAGWQVTSGSNEKHAVEKSVDGPLHVVEVVGAP